MTKKRKTPLGDHPVVVWVLVVSAVAALFAACVAIYIFATGKESIPEVLGLAPNEPAITTIHVTDVDGRPITRADVLLFYGGKYVNKSTGSDGVASFAIESSESDAVIIVEHLEYKVHEQSVNLKSNEVIRVKLLRVDGSNHTVIVRVFDIVDAKSVAGAEVTIIVGTEVYKEVTDDSGLAKFNLNFPTDTINVDLSVRINNSEFRNQVTLLQNSVQDIIINSATSSISVEPIQQRDTPMPLLPANTSSSTGSSVTLENFNKVEMGMTYEQVKDILGEGIIQNESPQQTLYQWEGAQFGQRIIITFRNGVVANKAQLGF